MASKTRMLILATAMLVLTGVALGPATVFAQEYSVQFSVLALPAGVRTHYYLDNVLNGTIQTGETKVLSFPVGSAHTLSVDLTVSLDNGTRYRCKDNFWSFAEAGTHTFTYVAQYRLEVSAPYVSPTGADWYDAGTTAYAELPINVTAGPEGVRYVFARWEGDASGQGLVSDPIVMDRAKKAVAAWKTQYSLKVSSDPVSVFAAYALWFDAGSTADFSVSEKTTGDDSRYVFAQWTGDYAGTSVQGSLRMDGPRSVTAKYKTQYLLTVTLTPPEIAKTSGMPNSTWYDAGLTEKLGPVPQSIPVNSGERLNLISWNVDGMTQQGTSIEVLMDRAHRVELLYRTQYHLEVTSQLGETTGSGWYYSGENARFGVIYSGPEFPVKYTLATWQSTPSTTIKTVSESEAEISMDRPYTVEAVWNADYTLTWIVISVVGLAVIVIAAVAILAVKKPSSLGKFVSSFRSSFKGRKLRPPGTGLPTPTAFSVCQKCGRMVPSSAEYCQTCGAQIRGRPAPPTDTETLDESVYDYIVKRHGEISLSRASKDLRLSADEIKRSTERLKKKGRLA